MPKTSSDRRDEFIKDRKYLLNVSDHTVSWYKHALYKWLPSDLPSDAELKSMVIRMREAGLRPTGCNAAIRAINAYLKWAGSGLKVPKLTFHHSQTSQDRRQKRSRLDACATGRCEPEAPCFMGEGSKESLEVVPRL